jgi:hypothetical protein
LSTDHCSLATDAHHVVLGTGRKLSDADFPVGPHGLLSKFGRPAPASAAAARQDRDFLRPARVGVVFFHSLRLGSRHRWGGESAVPGGSARHRESHASTVGRSVKSFIFPPLHKKPSPLYCVLSSGRVQVARSWKCGASNHELDATAAALRSEQNKLLKSPFEFARPAHHAFDAFL